MIQWKERLYAFLIRRFVGPWLDEEASQQLYQSIDVSLQDGIFVLRDVSLATQKLTALLQKPVRSSSVAFSKRKSTRTSSHFAKLDDDDADHQQQFG